MTDPYMECPYCRTLMHKDIKRVASESETWVHAEDNFTCTVSRVQVYHIPRPGPLKPAAVTTVPSVGVGGRSARGQPGAGGLPKTAQPGTWESDLAEAIWVREHGSDKPMPDPTEQPPAEPCQHDIVDKSAEGTFCYRCGERVG